MSVADVMLDSFWFAKFVDEPFELSVTVDFGAVLSQHSTLICALFNAGDQGSRR
jgi:hypothetical protein